MIVESKVVEPDWIVESRNRFDQHVTDMMKRERDAIEQRNKRLQEKIGGPATVRSSEG